MHTQGNPMKASMLRSLPMRLLFFFCALFCYVTYVVAVQKTLKAVNIGMIYGEGNRIEKMGLNCIKLGLSDFYSSHEQYSTRIVLHTREYPKDSVVGAAAAALYLIKYAEVKAITGPLTSMEAEFVIRLGEEAEVPIISYSETSPFISSIKSSYFIRAAQDNLPQAKAICALVQTFKWREIVPIYVDNDYGRGFIPYLDDALREIDARLPYHGVIPKFSTDDQVYQQLYKLKNMSARVFVVHMSPDVASRLFLKANELEMMEEGYVWIATTGISNELGLLDHSVIESMQGVIGLKTYVPQTNKLKEFNSLWDRKYHDMKLSIMGLWAYDAASALARAVEAVAADSDSDFQKKKLSENLTDLDAIGVSLVGPKLVQVLLNTSFTGLAGEFSLVDRQLESSTYKIINVIGSGSRDIGFWTPEKELAQDLNSYGSNLKAIIWPGEITSAPKGWAIPSARTKLRVGIPVKRVYEELVNVTQDKSTTKYNVRGFCIDVFEAVMDNLQYSDLFEYYPYPSPDTPTDSYDSLVQQVFHQKYDIVVGDITITANRSSNVDFSLPYTQSGVTMVVPVRNDRRSAWVFLMPLNWDLWVASLSAFIFIAFAIWVLEHRINNEFRGPPSYQAGTSLFYSFSLLVFAQRENVLSNLARFVVIIWVFVVFVLTQSYTASLTSMLTVQQLQPSVTEVHELIRKGAYVGFQQGSFVQGLLKQKGFQQSKLISYNSSEQLDDLLSKGSTNRGIAAVFDEIPYMKLFLAKYSSKYIMLQPIYKAEGFGFAFPKGSPLVPDVSRAILNVIEGDDMLAMEKAWGMVPYNSSDEGNKVAPSSSLSLESFWGLFLIAGVASGFSLLVFTVTFLYEHRLIWLYSDSSIWRKAQDLAEAFVQRDMASHTFRKNEMHNTAIVKTDVLKSNLSGENTDDSSPRPSTYSDHTEEDFVFSAITTPLSERAVLPLNSAETEVICLESDHDHSI